MYLRSGKVLLVVAFVMLVSACSSSDERRAVYDKRAHDTKSLELPPELSMPKSNQAMNVPLIGSDLTTYTAYSGQSDKNSQSVLPQAKSVRFVRDGNMHWLEIKASTDVIWYELSKFFREAGFEITFQDPRIGIMETNWLENRADLPTNWFSKLLNKLYSTGLKDKYRIHIERANATNTRVFIAHRGLEEVALTDSGSEVVETTWQPRASDPELEVEMLQRFLVYRGLTEDDAKSITARKTQLERAVLKDVDNNYALQVNENFPRTWRRVGLALDRVGLMVEDRNRSAGLYYIQLTEEYREKQKQGWFASLFASEQETLDKELLLKVDDQGQYALVTVRNRKGSSLNAEATKQILSQLQVHLR